MTAAILPFTHKRKRNPPQALENKTFKEGAIYLYRRADYIKPIWFIRLKVPGVKGYIWRSSKTTDEHAAYRVAEDLYNQSLGKIYAGIADRRYRSGNGSDSILAAILPFTHKRHAGGIQ